MEDESKKWKSIALKIMALKVDFEDQEALAEDDVYNISSNKFIYVNFK